MVSGGPIFPALSVLIASLLMLRWLAFRPVRRLQFVAKEAVVVATFGMRKSEQSNSSLRIVPMSCICKEDPDVCLFCLVTKFVALRDGCTRSQHLFCHMYGKPLSVRAVAETVRHTANILQT